MRPIRLILLRRPSGTQAGKRRFRPMARAIGEVRPSPFCNDDFRFALGKNWLRLRGRRNAWPRNSRHVLRPGVVDIFSVAVLTTTP